MNLPSLFLIHSHWHRSISWMSNVIVGGGTCHVSIKQSATKRRVLIGCSVQQGVNQSDPRSLAGWRGEQGGRPLQQKGEVSPWNIWTKTLQVRVWWWCFFPFFSFFLLLFIQEKCLFAKNVIRKVMGVIAVQFQFWFQFDRHNKTQTCRPPPSTFHLQPLSCCADWAVGGGGSRPSLCAQPAEPSARRADGLNGVILEERLHEHAQRAEHAHEHEDPQKEAVNHHGNVLPVLAHLGTEIFLNKRMALDTEMSRQTKDQQPCDSRM